MTSSPLTVAQCVEVHGLADEVRRGHRVSHLVPQWLDASVARKRDGVEQLSKALVRGAALRAGDCYARPQARERVTAPARVAPLFVMAAEQYACGGCL
jgi:hypothetical protein